MTDDVKYKARENVEVMFMMWLGHDLSSSSTVSELLKWVHE